MDPLIHPEYIGMPPLHAAVMLDEPDRVMQLLKAGANLEAVHQGKTVHDLVKDLVNDGPVLAILQSWKASRAIDDMMKVNFQNDVQNDVQNDFQNSSQPGSFNRSSSLVGFRP